jgi:hypothetical protein
VQPHVGLPKQYNFLGPVYGGGEGSPITIREEPSTLTTPYLACEGIMSICILIPIYKIDNFTTRQLN